MVRIIKALYKTELTLPVVDQGRIQDFCKGGSIIGLQVKEGGGGPGGGPTFGPMLKNIQRGQKGGSGPPGPPCIRPCRRILHVSANMCHVWIRVTIINIVQNIL